MKLTKEEYENLEAAKRHQDNVNADIKKSNILLAVCVILFSLLVMLMLMLLIGAI